MEGLKLAYKGKFRPDNPKKYNGNPDNIIYRSLWEAKFFRYLDRHPAVKWWASEELFVRYIHPKDNKYHRYFPDVICCIENPETKKLTTMMIEIKPLAQTKPPNPAKKNSTKTGRISRRYINECKTYEINKAKWEAAKEFCLEKGWEWKIYTEKELGVK